MLIQSPPNLIVSDSEQMAYDHPAPRKTIFDFIPARLVLRLAKPYLAGVSCQQAIELAHQLHGHSHFCSTLDILGEDAQSKEDCDASVENYQRVINAIKANPLQVLSDRQQMTISMKPSMFSTMTPQPGKESEVALEAAFDRISQVVDYAFRSRVNVTLEAEDHRWTNFQLEAYFALVSAGYTNLGTVLQTRLFRTEKDLRRFDDRMRVRLVIGIYNEPRQIAHTDKRAMKELVVNYALELLNRGTYVELATHDVGCVESFYRRFSAASTLQNGRFEHQFLLGVPRSKLQNGLVDGSYFSTLMADADENQREKLESLRKSGSLVRMYLPFGTAEVSGAYCRRRLRENPNMITYGIKNLLGIQ